MVFGKEIFYQDAYSAGTNNTRYFAEDINEFIMAMQGNYVVSGCDVTVGAETNLGVSGNHLAVASGTAFVNGVVRTIGSTNIDLSTAFAALSAGESRLIQVYITAAGAVSTQSGDIVTDGSQLPEVSSTGWTIANTTPLAWIYLVASDTTMSANQIFNQIVYAPTGQYINGFSYLDGNVDIYPPDQVRIYDPDDSDALLFDFDTTNRILDIFNASDLGTVNMYADLDVKTKNISGFTQLSSNPTTVTDSQITLQENSLGGLSFQVFSADNIQIQFDAIVESGTSIAKDTSVARILKNSDLWKLQGSTGNTIDAAASYNDLLVIDLSDGSISGSLVADAFVPSTYINATAVNIASQVHNNSTDQYGTETISGALNKYFEMQFSIPAFTGTESLSGSENVAVQFQTNVGAGWVTQSTCNITPSGYGSWSSSTFTVQFSESGTFQWRLNLIETNQDTGVNGYNPDSFTPTYKVALKT